MPSIVVATALAVAFPQEGQILPAVSHTYVIGSVATGSETVCVNGTCVTPHRTGAWTTLVPVKAGSNTLTVACGAEKQTVRFNVGRPPAKVAAPVQPVQPRVYRKLAYAADAPAERREGRTPPEMTVVLDAGHGGADRGTVSPHGRAEKDYNLALAKAVREALVRRGFTVVMTRVDDIALELYERPRVALGVGADVFVSIHYNAPPCNRDAGNIRYQSVYAWNPLGEKLAKAINVRMATIPNAARNNGVLHANFAVTRNPEIPSCLIEADFLTHPAGEEAADDANFRARQAEAIAAGIADYLAPSLLR